MIIIINGLNPCTINLIKCNHLNPRHGIKIIIIYIMTDARLPKMKNKIKINRKNVVTVSQTEALIV